MQLPDGIAYCDDTCRRGELVCWPSWTDAPLPAMEVADAKPVLAMMGANPESDRRDTRSCRLV